MWLLQFDQRQWRVEESSIWPYDLSNSTKDMASQTVLIHPRQPLQLGHNELDSERLYSS